MKENTLLYDESPLLRSVLDGFEDGACLLDPEGRLNYMNEAAERLTGYKSAELQRLPFFTRLGMNQEPQPDAPHWRSVSLKRKDGLWSEALLQSRRLGEFANAPILIKLRKRESQLCANLSLAEIKEKLWAIFDTIPDGLILINESGRIQLFNAAAERLFGYRREETLEKNVNMLMPSPYAEQHDRYLAAYAKTGIKKIIGIGREVKARRKDGLVFPIYLSVGELTLEGRPLFVGVIHDLTEHKRAEQRLLTLSSAIDQSPTAVLIADKDGVIRYVNQSFERLTGYTAGEVVGKNPKLLRSDRTPREQYRRLWSTIQSGREWRGEIEDRRKDGSLYWAQETITPLRDANGEITHYLSIQQDVTEQKRDKEALTESEARFRHVAEMTGEWLWEQDPEGRYVYSSGAVQRILGFMPEEILGKKFVDLQPQIDDGQASEPGPWPARPFFRLVNRYRHKNGMIVFTESSGAPIFDESGRIVKWRGVDHDITEQKAFEDALRLRDRAMESVHVGIAISDALEPSNPNIYVNPALCRITGYTREELIGKTMRMLRGPDTDIAAIEQIRQAIAARRDCEVTLKNYQKGGSPFWDQMLISPVADETGRITNFVATHTDVTERRKAAESRQELEIAKHIQASLLPDAPLHLPSVELAGLCAPASQVGGDYFDFFENAQSVDVVIADVSGHSVGAALIMTEVRSALRLEIRKAGATRVAPWQMLKDLNELLYDDLTKAESFITMFYMKFEPETRILSYANAGHNRALLLRAASSGCMTLDADGLVLGVLRSVDFEEASVELSPGDALLLYTDGVSEARNAQGDFFGVDRLSAAFEANRALRPEALVKRLMAELSAFCGDEPLDDDVAMVVMQTRQKT
jgi:sigma-B regulation protein RsbU (phosphoserine phosphatase)